MIEEGVEGFSWGSGVAARISSRFFGELRRPVATAASDPTVIPSSKTLEAGMLMTAERVEQAIRKVGRMKPVLVPTTDVNSETGLLLAWHAGDRSEVQAGEAIAEIETSKAIFDVPAPEGGFLLHAAREGAEVRLTEPVARLFADLSALEAYADQEQRRRAEAAGSGTRATEPARRRAEELGVDLASIGGDSLITVGMVEAAAAAATTAAIELPDPLPGAAGLPRIALFGAASARCR